MKSEFHRIINHTDLQRYSLPIGTKKKDRNMDQETKLKIETTAVTLS